MKHHPDTVGNDCQETQQKSQIIFMKCRKALESLEECPKTGIAILKTTAELKRRSMSNEEFDEWFEEETGHRQPFQFDLDPKVMREVADMHNDMEGSHGLDRDGVSDPAAIPQEALLLLHQYLYVALGEYDFECGQAGEGGRRECVEVGSGDCEGWRGGGVGNVVEAEKKECEEKMMHAGLIGMNNMMLLQSLL
eukprot:scaffold2619_cov150-Skeletonema_menzelii.AAC.2